MTAPALCTSCGTDLRPSAKFCDECGTPARDAAPAEYKQVTVLFADVVRSMELAAAAGPERLREVMAELVRMCADVVHRYGGTVDKFLGDGIMALFGAPKALEDHAVRACRAALDIQARVGALADDVQLHEAMPFRLRIGLNSGQVIAGEIGSGPSGYTATGEQVGMAQRMESVASAGGVLLSESTARLVEHSTVLSESRAVAIKGSDVAVHARQLLGMKHMTAPDRNRARLVGRDWELNALSGLLSRAIDGTGSVVGVVGPPGIGKSRITAEVGTLAARGGVEVATAYCESHTSDVPFHAAAELIRAGLGISDLDDRIARSRVREEFALADEEDLALVDDLLDIAEPGALLPVIDPDARRRRLTALINAAVIARTRPFVYVIEDVHWIDPISESLLADFLAAIPLSRALVVVTYRPEYRGLLARAPRSQTIALEPLRDNEIATLAESLLGTHDSMTGLIEVIAERAAGNPFFAEEIIRDLVEQGVLTGHRGAYRCDSSIEDVTVPGALQSVIAARIDRLNAAAKATLNAAAVVGSRFSVSQLTAMHAKTELNDLVAAELIDQIGFGTDLEYAFRHPLIRAVAYESQLSADRARLHRRVAASLEQVDSNASLIAEHLQAAGDLVGAFEWHMKAGAWSVHRNIAAAQLSWERAVLVADALPPDDPAYLARRIAPRTMLCGTVFRRFHKDMTFSLEELRGLCEQADDRASLAVAIAGHTSERVREGRVAEASKLASEYMGMIETLHDPELAAGLSAAAMVAKTQALEAEDVMRWSEAVIDLAERHEGIGTQLLGSPLAVALAFYATVGWTRNHPGWQNDLDRVTTMLESIDPVSRAMVIGYKYIGIPRGVMTADAAALAEIEQALSVAEQSSDDLALFLVQLAHGLTLIHHSVASRDRGYQVLADLRETAWVNSYGLNMVPLLDAYAARQSADLGDHEVAADGLRAALDDMMNNGNFGNTELAIVMLAETLMERGTPEDLREVETLIGRLSSPIYDQVPAMRDIQRARLRSLLALTRRDADYPQLRDEYRNLATELGFAGQRVWADALP